MSGEGFLDQSLSGGCQFNVKNAAIFLILSPADQAPFFEAIHR